MLWSGGYSWVSEDWRIIRFCEKILLYLIRAKSYTAYGTKLAVRTVLSRVLFRGLLEKTSPCMQSRMGFIWLHFGRRRTLFFFFSILGKFQWWHYGQPRMLTFPVPLPPLWNVQFSLLNSILEVASSEKHRVIVLPLYQSPPVMWEGITSVSEISFILFLSRAI